MSSINYISGMSDNRVM